MQSNTSTGFHLQTYHSARQALVFLWNFIFTVPTKEKGPSDGAGAAMKNSGRRADIGEKVIVNNSKDFFECAMKMTKEMKVKKNTLTGQFSMWKL